MGLVSGPRILKTVRTPSSLRIAPTYFMEVWYFWAKKPRLFYLYGHSFEFPRDNNWDRIEEFGKKMAERNDVWHATNMEIYKYVEAFKRLVFSADGNIIENPSAIDVYINVIDNDVLVKAGSTVSIAK